MAEHVANVHVVKVVDFFLHFPRFAATKNVFLNALKPLVLHTPWLVGDFERSIFELRRRLFLQRGTAYAGGYQEQHQTAYPEA